MTTNELPSGQVTIADLYRELTGMRTDFARALSRVEVIDAQAKDADRLHADHEARLRALERFRFTLAGVSVIGGIVAGAVGYWVGHLVH